MGLPWLLGREIWNRTEWHWQQLLTRAAARNRRRPLTSAGREQELLQVVTWHFWCVLGTTEGTCHILLLSLILQWFLPVPVTSAATAPWGCASGRASAWRTSLRGWAHADIISAGCGNSWRDV